MPPSMVHFNGSVNLADAEKVMREIAARVPVGVRRIPDGETGDRANWIFFQFRKFAQSPWFEQATPGKRGSAAHSSARHDRQGTNATRH